VNRLVCEDCGAVYYSAAAKTLADQGQTCAKCGGRLVFVDGPEPRPVVPVNGPDPQPANGPKDS
jgi:DNA-directed RNA polymerase subunit RPC12/RpoP